MASVNVSQLGMFEVTRLRHRYLLGTRERAYAMALKAEAAAPYLAGVFESVDVSFYGSLARTGIYRAATPSQRRELDAQLDSSQLYLESCALRCPENFRHLHLTVEAERARLRDDPYRAMELFDRAIAGAADCECLHVEAIAHELAGRMWHERGRLDLASSYLRGARDAYELWGASAKCAALLAEFPELGERRPRPRGPSIPNSPTRAATAPSTSTR